MPRLGQPVGARRSRRAPTDDDDVVLLFHGPTVGHLARNAGGAVEPFTLPFVDSESERELAIVIAEEGAKLMMGADAYRSLPYLDWVEALKPFVQTQQCGDCGGSYDIDDFEEEIWGWFVEGEGRDIEEMEVVEFLCETVLLDIPLERELTHPRTLGTLLFRRGPTGTFPLDDEDGDEDDEV